MPAIGGSIGEQGMPGMSDVTHYLDEARGLLSDAVALRRRIHARPELGLDLPETTQAVLDAITGLDVQVARGPSTTGLVVSLTGTKPQSQTGRTILLRGDMDALAMPEDTGLDFASEIPGRMHACGHDSHTAMLVGAVHLLHRHRDALAGTVKFMFQPGEEGHAGARHMIEDGLLDADPKPDAAFALHIMPQYRTGTIIVKGRGGHASMPSQAVDPIPVACEIVLALQSFVTRRIETFDPVVITCAQIAAGTTTNVIPETATLLGTMRATSEKAREAARAGLHRVAENIARAHLCEAAVEIRAGYPVTVNDGDFAAFARDVAVDLVGGERFVAAGAPLMGAEDFSYVLHRMPGCMFFLGVQPDSADGHFAPCHSNHMMLDEDAMAVGIAMHAAVAQRFLDTGLIPGSAG
jgi:amidohydrolase